jgi:succinate dehydrogenase / fumarate reductase flavoprotein subunit
MVSYLKDAESSNVQSVKTELESEEQRIKSIMDRDSSERLGDIRDELKSMMFEHFGVYREESKMQEGLEKLKALQDRFTKASIDDSSKEFNMSLVHALELEGMLNITEAVCLGAIARRESRGAHSRTDYPKRDDEKFLKHTLAFKKDGKMELEYSDVTLGMFEVAERAY